MAVRLLNLHHATLRIDLRGGEVLVLERGARSAALREELLYDNHHLAEWERAGWIARMPARMQEVLDAEAPAEAPEPAQAQADAVEANASAAEPASRAEAPAMETPAEKAPRRKRASESDCGSGAVN